MEPNELIKDEQLVNDVLAGNTNAFNQLVTRYFGMVYMIGYARFRRRESGEDLAQETFLQAFLHLPKLSQPQLFPAWVCRIARNLATDWQRHNQRVSKLLPMVPIEELPKELIDSRNIDVREQLEITGQNKVVQEAILKLPAELREIILLYYSEGLNKEEIARLLGIHHTTVGRQLKKALSMLKGILEPVLRESSQPLRASQKAAFRTIAIITAATAISESSKSEILAIAGDIAQLTAESLIAPPAGTIEIIKPILEKISRGSNIFKYKKTIAVLVTAVAIIGFIYYSHNPKEIKVERLINTKSNQPVEIQSNDNAVLQMLKDHYRIQANNTKNPSDKQIEIQDESDDYLFPIVINSDTARKYGYINRSGKIVVKPQIFDLAYEFTDGLGSIMINRKWGFIDKTGKIVIAPQFGKTYGFTEGLASVNVDGKFGYINHAGEFIIPPQFDEAYHFRDGIALVKVDDKWGSINTTGKYIIELQHDKQQEFYDGLAKVRIDNKWGYIDKTGIMVIKPQYDDTFNFSEGLAPVEIDGKWAYIDKRGIIIIAPQFDNAYTFSEGLALVYINNQWGYINKTGELVFTMQTGYRGGGFQEGLATIHINNKVGYIDKTGKIVVQPQFGYVSHFSEGLAKVVLDNKWYFIDTTGKIVIKLQSPYPPSRSFEPSVFDFKHGLAQIDDIGYIDRTGKYVWHR
jgi:RNA polymerase sigma factor (sigma-70 family)